MRDACEVSLTAKIQLKMGEIQCPSIAFGSVKSIRCGGLFPRRKEMVKLTPDYAERVYAGVLGKVIGVYLGRPFGFFEILK